MVTWKPFFIEAIKVFITSVNQLCAVKSSFYFLHSICLDSWPYMWPCLNELQKEYCVKIKLIALDWQWVTLISWCQMNRLGHSSPVMHKVQGKTHTVLEKLKITSGKSTSFRLFSKSIFRSPMLTSEFLLIKNTPILHTCLTLCWSCLCSTTSHSVVKFFWGVVRVKKQKTIASSRFHRK